MFKSREEVDRTAWRTIDNLPQSPFESAGKARPKSFSEFEVLLEGGEEFDCVLSMFLHEFYQHRDPRFFSVAPSARLSDIRRAALAGATEWLCHHFGYEVPSWTEGPDFFLKSERNYFEDDLGTSEAGLLLKEVFSPEMIVSIRDDSIKGSAHEFLRRNLLFPVRGLIRI